MSRISLLLIVLLAVALLVVMAVPVRAILIEIPLPGLHGTYPVTAQNYERRVTFRMIDPPAAIHGAWFTVAGTTGVGVIECDGVQYEWPTMLYAYMEDTFAHIWIADEPMPFTAGEFGWTAAFTPSPPIGTTWNFLLDGTADIVLSGGPSGYIGICSEVSAPPTLTVTSATLILDVDIPIRTEPSTWGKIKALYR